MSIKIQTVFCVIIFALLAICFRVYEPGLSGIFLVDDNVNLVALNQNGGVDSLSNGLYFIFNNTSGMLGRPVSMLSFLINDQYYPGSVEFYRYTNVLVHLLCGLLLLLFISRFLRQLGESESFSWMVGLVVSAWWLFAPINVSTALYPIQRMTQLSALFTLAGLLCYLRARSLLTVSRSVSGVVWLSCGLYLFGALAVFSKENGVLIFVYAATCELALTCKNSESSNRWVKAAIGAPLIIGLAYFCYKFGSWVGGYRLREFTLEQRLLTETRILFDYLGRIIFSNTHKMGLIQDDFQLSTSLISPVTTLLSIISHFALLVIAWVYRRKWIVFSFSVFWFYSGHLLESTVIPLELYFEHRNYMPAMGAMLGVIYYLLKAQSFILMKKGAVAVLIFLAFWGCKQRAQIWGDPPRQITIWAAEHPESLRAQTIYVKHLARSGNNVGAYEHLLKAIKNWPSAVHLDLIAVNLACTNVISYAPPPDYLLAKVKVADYSSQQITEIQNLAEAAKSGRCKEITDPLIHLLLREFINKDLYRTKTKASLAFINAELYIKERNLNEAVFWLGESYRYHRDSIPLYMQSRALASAGLYGDAKVSIAKAIRHEEKQSFVKQKNLQAYRKFEEKLQRLSE